MDAREAIDQGYPFDGSQNVGLDPRLFPKIIALRGDAALYGTVTVRDTKQDE